MYRYIPRCVFLTNRDKTFSAVYLSHMHNTVGGGVQQTEAGCNAIILQQRSNDFVNSTLTTASTLITTNSLEIFISVFFVCVSPLSQGEVIVFFLGLSRVRRVINPHTCSRWIADRASGLPVIKSAERPEPLTGTFVFTHKPSEKLWRISGVTCTSESIFCFFSQFSVQL